MNNKITKLPTQVVNQIAAGEVVERPAAAIKELVENSIDASATQIQVQVISKDGRSFRVIDNGSGIAEEDLELAFSPHATSKITNLEDLNALETMGFRGEALASISSVSEVVCITKTKDSENAIKAEFKDGKLIKSPAALSGGTSFEIKNLFSNVPARLKFLKRPETEVQAIVDIVKEIAIANPEVSFQLDSRGKKVFRTSGSGNWEQAVKEVFQDSCDLKYLEVMREEEPIIKLQGLIAPASAARSDKRGMVTLVNNRVVKCEIMQKAIRAVYKGFLPAGKYPRIILSLTLPSNEVDVNVHPTKKEVRYIKPQIIYQLIQNSLEKHLILQASSATQTPQTLLTEESHKAEKVPCQGDLGVENQLSIEKVKKFEREYGINKNFVPPQKVEKETEAQEKLVPKRETSKVTKPLEFDLKQNLFSNILQLSEIELRRNTNKASNKSHKSDRGNSTDFTLASGDFQISGQVNGPKWIREKLLDSLSQWLLSVDLDWENHEEYSEQQKILEQSKTRRPKINQKVLEEVWQRDGWRCVYCGKYLLHPLLSKKALRDDPESWIQRLGQNNKLIKTHLFREHQASYDHFLPHSHNPSLSTNAKNLHACCRSCNQEKSNSTNQSKWQPQKFEPWLDREIEIGNLVFSGGDKGSDYSILVRS